MDGLGKSDGISLVANQLESETKVSDFGESVYETWMAARNPGGGAVDLPPLTTRTENMFPVAFSAALSTSADFHPS